VICGVDSQTQIAIRGRASKVPRPGFGLGEKRGGA
jgi:hypothetical protein